MKRQKELMSCVSCSKEPLTKDEIGICKKLLGEEIGNLYCLPCLAEYLEVNEQDILDKIEEFRAEGCKLFL